MPITAASAFSAYLRKGGEEGEDMRGPSIDELRLLQREHFAIKNAAGVSIGTLGGFTVPEGFYAGIVEAQKSTGAMFDCGAEIITTDSGSAFPIPTDNDTANAGQIVIENTQMADASDIPFGQTVLGSYAFSSRPIRVSFQMTQDSALDLDSHLAKKIGIRIARGANPYLTVGTGASQPLGVVTAAVKFGNGYICPTGETAGFQWSDLDELTYRVDPAYWPTSRFMLNATTLRLVKELHDSSNRPIWQPPTVAGQPGLIFGYPYTLNQDMPSPAAGAVSILFGDFSAYKIRRVKGVQVIRLVERYVDYGQVGFIGWERLDGQLADAGTHPLAYMQQSAT